MEWIQSKNNDRVKSWRKLQTAKGRKQAGAYLIEGPHLIQEALKTSQVMEWLLIREDWVDELGLIEGIDEDRVIQLAKEAFDSLAMTQQSQGIMAVLQIPATCHFSLKGDRYLLCDGVQDPGNLGTLIRTADAAGLSGVVLNQGCVDLYNDKVIRSSQGSLWHLPILQGWRNDQILEVIRESQLPIYASALHRQAQSYQYLTGKKGVLVVGNEGQGVSETFLQRATEKVYIPMPGQAESLNVAVASGILMFEWVKA